MKRTLSIVLTVLLAMVGFANAMASAEDAPFVLMKGIVWDDSLGSIFAKLDYTGPCNTYREEGYYSVSFSPVTQFSDWLCELLGEDIAENLLVVGLMFDAQSDGLKQVLTMIEDRDSDGELIDVIATELSEYYDIKPEQGVYEDGVAYNQWSSLEGSTGIELYDVDDSIHLLYYDETWDIQ